MTSPTDPEPEHQGTGAERGALGRRRALVVGTGLIGGSLGLALRKRGWHVTGRDSDPARAREALDRGVLDEVGDDPEAEMIFVAVPATAAGLEASRLLSDRSRRPDAVVTDVSSVKDEVVRVADHPRFVGGHPMAGSEQLGLQGADPDLFIGATWVLTPSPVTDPGAFSRAQEVVRSLGSEVVALSPQEHDRLVAVVSHVPHLVAATLMNAAASVGEEHAVLLRLAAGGFRDMTRIAAGHPGIWPDICADNGEAIVEAFDRLLVDLSRVRDLVRSSDRAEIAQVLDRASVARRALSTRATEPETLAELRIPVPDRTGVLAEITTLAGEAGVNIADFEIAHSTEGSGGVLVLVVDASEADGLRQALSTRGYSCTVQELG